jgi:hypothetical protein
MVAAVLQVLGLSLLDQGRYAEAEPLLLHSVAALTSTFGEAHERAAEARRKLVSVYEAWGRPAQASRFREATDPSAAP